METLLFEKIAGFAVLAIVLFLFFKFFTRNKNKEVKKSSGDGGYDEHIENDKNQGVEG